MSFVYVSGSLELPCVVLGSTMRLFLHQDPHVIRWSLL